MTLLFQDPSGGLEVFHREFGVWTGVTPIPNTVVVNIADLFMRWSNDRMVSTLHRVVATPQSKGSSRYSIAHFVNPNANFEVDPRDVDQRIKAATMAAGTAAEEGSHYSPIKTHEYLEERLSATFLDSETTDTTAEKTEL
jgi:isopenicillin N synthase-like dioxygenase